MHPLVPSFSPGGFMTRFSVLAGNVLSGLVLLGGAALLGCAATSPVPATAASGLADDDDRTADLNDYHRHHHQGGVTAFIALSLDTLGLPPEQRAIGAKIQSELFARMAPARAGEQAVLTALADGLAAGAIDKARVDAALAELERASGQVPEATADALNQLHAALTRPQRAALVDKIWAHWAIFQEASEGELVGTVQKGRSAGRLADLATDLGLSADQVAKIGASFHALMLPTSGLSESAIDVHLARLAAFGGDTFDARTLSGARDADARVASRGAARMALFYEAAAPLLTPEQRAKLAILLREHATHDDAASAAR
jgi:Spy/CpxP family protein refolding chaperone